MKVSVVVKPGAKFEKVEETMDGELKVWLKEPAKDGLANHRLVKLLADYYDVRRSDVRIKLGLTSKKKLIEVDK